LKQKQEFLQKTMLTIYFVLLTLGILLYMIEYTMRMTMISASIAYAVTLIWVAINWFYFRPRMIRKQQKELNEMIEKLENVNRQLDSGE